MVADAVITTMPATQSLTTDALGSVLFSDLAVGAYAVTANHPTKGAAREAIEITENAVAQLTLVLGGGAGGGGGGTSGTGGAGGAGGAHSGTGGMVGGGTGGSGMGGGIITLGTGGTGQGGKGVGGYGVGGYIFGVGGYGVGGFMPGTGGRGTGGTPAGAISLDPLTKDTNGINLTWTVTSGSFSTLRVYRSQANGSFALIDILQDPTRVQYRDETVQMGVVYGYRIGGVPASGGEVLSNTQSITAGVFIALGSQVETMMVDRTRPYLYALDRVNNSLHFVNLTTNTVDKTIFVGSQPADIDINAANTTLFVANFGSTEIAVVDLEMQAKTGSLLVDTAGGVWDGNPYRLACAAGDTLAFTSLDQWNDIKLVNALTGARLDDQGTLYEPDLAATPDGASVYVGESGISSSTLTRFDIVGGKLSSVDVSGDAGGYSTREVIVSRNGTYVFYAGKKYLAKNLKSVLGTFSEPIVAATSDGGIAIGSKNIFDGTTFSVKKLLPISASVVAISSDDSTLYLYDTTSSNIYVYRL